MPAWIARPRLTLTGYQLRYLLSVGWTAFAAHEVSVDVLTLTVDDLRLGATVTAVTAGDDLIRGDLESHVIPLCESAHQTLRACQDREPLELR